MLNIHTLRGVALPVNIRKLKQKIRRVLNKWNEVQGKSGKAVNSLVGIIGKMILAQNDEMFTDLQNFPELQERLLYRLANSINSKMPQLEQALELFRKLKHELDGIVQEELRNLRATLRAAAELTTTPRRTRRVKKVKSLDHEEFSRELSVIEQAEKHLLEIQQMFELELSLKEYIFTSLVDNLLKPQQMTLYLTLWIAEPYLDVERIEEILEEFIYLERALDKSSNHPLTLNSSSTTSTDFANI